jgi:hypothetical protein
MTLDLHAIVHVMEQVPDQRKRHGVRYPFAMLLTIAVLAKRCGATHIHAMADWAHERLTELAHAFRLTRARMPHPTTWTHVLGYGVAAQAIENAVTPLLASVAASTVPARASQHSALDGKTMHGTIPAGGQGVHLVSAVHVGACMVLRQRAVPSNANAWTMAPPPSRWRGCW